ncbi:hypothetical protein [Aeromonas sp. Y311-2]|uniref:hypothetical protein n=1 Tax=Aeromonas sp. Y311-2 TaxID=2990507 RepID=UPI0022E01A30|nr:hypothetical protein [Aeromonas sp. Y311-2]
MENQYVDFESCVIERVKVPTFDSEKKFVPMVRLTDEEGGNLFNFPDSFTDEQIKVAVAFANQSYRLGKVYGAEAKAHESRASLGLSCGKTDHGHEL